MMPQYGGTIGNAVSTPRFACERPFFKVEHPLKLRGGYANYVFFLAGYVSAPGGCFGAARGAQGHVHLRPTPSATQTPRPPAQTLR